MKFIVHTDGGARGNPGPAAIGVVIECENGEWRMENGDKKLEFGKRIGETTNNVAEYSAVREALTYLRAKNEKNADVQFYLDSRLVVQQLNGVFKVKDVKLRELLTQIRVLEQEVGGEVRYAYVPREQNRRADFLVNQALDQQIDKVTK